MKILKQILSTALQRHALARVARVPTEYTVYKLDSGQRIRHPFTRYSQDRWCPAASSSVRMQGEVQLSQF